MKNVGDVAPRACGCRPSACALASIEDRWATSVGSGANGPDDREVRRDPLVALDELVALGAGQAPASGQLVQPRPLVRCAST